MNNQAEYLPFNAINEFMRPDFRLSVIRDTLNALPSISEVHSDRINRLTRKLVKIPGFRNSEKAPVLMKVIPISKSFEKSSELVAVILAAWAEVFSNLRKQVYDLLVLRGWVYLPGDLHFNFSMLGEELLKKWPLLPPEVDRTKLPGFYIRWPKDEHYETLYSHFTNLYPDANESIDKVSLMIVWLSLRLPYHMEDHDLISSENKVSTAQLDQESKDD